MTLTAKLECHRPGPHIPFKGLCASELAEWTTSTLSVPYTSTYALQMRILENIDDGHEILTLVDRDAQGGWKALGRCAKDGRAVGLMQCQNKVSSRENSNKESHQQAEDVLSFG